MRGISNSSSKEWKAYCSKKERKKCNSCSFSGILKVVGIGPGGKEHITKRAYLAIKEAEVIVGYRRYIELLDRELIFGKRIISTEMRKEVERCKKAIENALSGRYTVIISSGDPGIYGMAGLIVELLIKEDLLSEIDLEIIPGVPALCAASSLLGAPLMNDFSVISLSDLLTPWHVIEKRIKASLEGDFVIVLYNPRSRKRNWQLKKALSLIQEKRGDVPVGIVKNAMREGETVIIRNINDVDESTVDMNTILIVGNSETFTFGRFMITPRGYNIE